MVFMRKLLCLLTAFSALSILSSCSNSTKKTKYKQYYSSPTEPSQISESVSGSDDEYVDNSGPSDEKITENSVNGSSTDDTSESSDNSVSTSEHIDNEPTENVDHSDGDESSGEPVVETTTYRSVNEDFLSVEDKDVIVTFCNDMCHRWARLYNGKEERDFSAIAEYEPLAGYLSYLADNTDIASMPYSDDTHFELSSLDFENGKAIARGRYEGVHGCFGEWIYIITNRNGDLILNDMAVNGLVDFPDTLYRMDFVRSPYPDYWSDYSNYSELASKTFEKKD